MCKITTYSDLRLKNNGFDAMTVWNHGHQTFMSAEWPRFVIRMAWDKGMDVEDLADGYGKGLGTMGGDWSGIRDSSDEAIAKMTCRAINYLEKCKYVG